MKSREKLLVGLGILLIGGYFGITVLVMPAVDNVIKKHTQLAVTQTEVATLDAQLANLHQRVQRLRVMKEMPKDVTIRTYKPDEFEASVKAMVDDVVRLATQSGNSLTAIKPWSAPSPGGGPSSALSKPAARRGKATTQQSEPQSEPQPQINIQSRGYELTFQGTYKPILEYLGALSTYPELIEVENVSFQHQGEASLRGSSQSQAVLHEDQPIRVVLRLILYLQPE